MGVGLSSVLVFDGSHRAEKSDGKQFCFLVFSFFASNRGDKERGGGEKVALSSVLTVTLPCVYAHCAVCLELPASCVSRLTCSCLRVSRCSCL